MRHRIAGRSLGRDMDHRDSLRRNLITRLFQNERIKTTQAKALAIRGEAEKLITLAKRGNRAGDARMVSARRLAATKLHGPEAVKKLFDEIAPRFESRPGGYTRVVKLGPRNGDAAAMVIVELVEE